MLKELTPLQGFQGVDCRHLSIINIMKFKKYMHYRSIWKQCGIYYARPPLAQTGGLKGKYIKLNEELNAVHGIDTFYKKVSYDQEFIEQIKTVLSQEEAVVVYVDTFNLKGNLYFGNKHMLHTITLVNFEEGIFSFVDDTFCVTGQLTQEDLLKAAWLNRNGEYTYSYIFLSSNNVKNEISLTDYYYIISRNTKYMSGELNSSEINMLSEIHNNSKVVPGLEGIKSFVSDYEKFLDENDVLDEQTYYSTYLALMELSNCHYRYSEFVSSGIHLNADFMNLSKLLQDIGQEWKVTANMMIKGMFKKDSSMFLRMLNKVKTIVQKAEEIIDLSRSLLKDSVPK